MNDKDRVNEIGFEGEIVERIHELIKFKKADNEHAIGRLNTMETAWKDVNAELDNEVGKEIELLKDEAIVIAEAKARLEKNPCTEADKETFSLAGKFKDVDTKVGLVGLKVKIGHRVGDKETIIKEAKTDIYGNFTANIPIAELPADDRKKKELIVKYLSEADEVIHTEAIKIEPEVGKVEHITHAVRCTGKLKPLMEYGNLVKESIKSDEALLKGKAENMKEAYNAFGRLTDTALSSLKELKDELSVNPPDVPTLPEIPEDPIKEPKKPEVPKPVIPKPTPKPPVKKPTRVVKKLPTRRPR